MPIETVKCQECGSADVTELKTGSYVCQHCESVFKWTKPGGSASGPAVCEVDDCGVLAVGRCGGCGRAFCADHQANDSRIVKRSKFGWDESWELVRVAVRGRCLACQLERARQEVEELKRSSPKRERLVCDTCARSFDVSVRALSAPGVMCLGCFSRRNDLGHTTAGQLPESSY